MWLPTAQGLSQWRTGGEAGRIPGDSSDISDSRASSEIGDSSGRSDSRDISDSRASCDISDISDSIDSWASSEFSDSVIWSESSESSDSGIWSESSDSSDNGDISGSKDSNVIIDRGESSFIRDISDSTDSTESTVSTVSIDSTWKSSGGSLTFQSLAEIFQQISHSDKTRWDKFDCKLNLKYFWVYNAFCGLTSSSCEGLCPSTDQFLKPCGPKRNPSLAVT